MVTRGSWTAPLTGNHTAEGSCRWSVPRGTAARSEMELSTDAGPPSAETSPSKQMSGHFNDRNSIRAIAIGYQSVTSASQFGSIFEI